MPIEDKDQQVDITNVQSDNVDNQQIEPEKTLDQLKAELSKFSGLTEKYKKEAEGYRKKNSELRKTEEEAEKKRLEDQGMYKEMYEANQKKLDSFQSAAQEGSRKHAIKEALLREGINDKYLNVMMGQVDLKKIELDSEFNADKEQVEFQVTQIKNQYIDLFKKEVTIKDGTPQGSTKNMSYHEELKTATNQTELNAVMAKHGRL